MFVTPVAPIVNVSGGSGSAAWGAITGTLSDQTDLQSALDAQTSYTDTVIAAHIAAADPHPQYLTPAEADASYASLVRTLTGTLSITGGGSLAADRTFSLVNDSATPGNSKLYGTDASGVKGWYAQPTGGSATLAALTDVDISAPANNQILKYVSATSKWTNSAAIDGVTVGATTAASGSFTSLKCTSWDNATPIFGAANRGLVPVTGSPTGKFLKDDGTWATVSAAPGGSDTQVQFNDASAFGGDAGLLYNKTTGVLTVLGGFSPTTPIGVKYNLVDNSEFLIAQRPAATLSATGFIVDRYQVTISGTGTIAWAVQASDNPRFAKHLRLTVGTADSSIAVGDLYTLQHAVEGLDCSFIKFGSANAIQLTLSFEVRCSMTGTFGVSFSNSALNRGYVGTFTINSANTWETKTITLTAGDTTGTWLTDTSEGLRLRWCLASGSTGQTATTNAWQASGTVYTTSAQTQWISTAGATFDITGINLTPAPVAWPYIHEKYNDVLVKCQRYLPAFFSTGSSSELGIGIYPSTTLLHGTIRLGTVARIAPTGMLVSGQGHFSGSDGVTTLAGTAVTFGAASLVRAVISVTVSGATAFRSARTLFNTASGYLLFTGAEL